jgi:hypothetical protein
LLTKRCPSWRRGPVSRGDRATAPVHIDPNDIPFEFPPAAHSVRRLTDDENPAFIIDFLAKQAAERAQAAQRKPRKIKLDEYGKEDIRAAAYRALHQQTQRRVAERLKRGLLTDRESSPSLHRILQILPKRVECGADKKAVRKDRKLFAMDKPYVTLDKRRLGAIIVDLDRSYASEYDLKETLAKLLPAGIQPNIGAGKILNNGTLVRPHLLFLLPPGFEVWTNNPQAVEFYHSIHRRLIRALIPAGADPNQIANPYKFKNPLSEEWDCVILSEKWHTLSEFHKALPRDISEGQLRREAAEYAGLFDLKGSMGYWNTIGRLATKVLTDARKRRDPDYMTAGANLGSWLRQAVTDVVTDRLGAPTDKERDIIARRTEFSARRWKVDYSACARGRDAAEIAKVTGGQVCDPKTAQRVAQRVTVEERHEAIVEAVARAMLEVTPQGADPYDHRPAVVRKTHGLVSRSGTYLVFKEAVIGSDVCP